MALSGAAAGGEPLPRIGPAPDFTLMSQEDQPLICDGDGPVMASRARYDQFLSDEAFETARGKRTTIRTKAR